MDKDDLLNDIEAMANDPEKLVPSIGLEKAKVLIDAVKKYQPKRILEIGTFHGYSAIILALALPEGGRILTIESDQASALEARKHILNANLVEEITVLTGRAQDVIPGLEDTFDMVFIDAEKTEYLEYLRSVEPKLAPGAIIISDNVGIFGDEMRDFLNYIRTSGNYRSKTYDFGTDAVEVSQRVAGK